MSSPATPSAFQPSLLLQTIVSDLKAGASWFETEAENVGLSIWNTVKSAFIALEPAAAKVLVDTLQTAVNSAEAGHSIEDIEASALNTATSEGKAALAQAGSGVVQTLIAGMRANALPGSTPTA
ncbi:MAG: hypothetical protein KGL39_04685 [Patescibacteria group bacterium]|nr:hypothetical protein [Patescibacteria group bacterium]